jgi:hypothetical protein
MWGTKWVCRVWRLGCAGVGCGGGVGRQGFSRSIVRVGRLMASWVAREHQRWDWER